MVPDRCYSWIVDLPWDVSLTILSIAIDKICGIWSGPGCSFVNDMEVFERIYQQHASSVLRFARRCVGREDVAEEIASEAFLELYRNLEQIDSKQLPAWLFTVVRNRAIDYWRRTKLETEYVKQAPEAIASISPSVSEGLLECRGLKAIHRTCLILRYVHGMTRAEIAKFTGLRETQIKGYLRSGLAALREAFSGQPG